MIIDHCEFASIKIFIESLNTKNYKKSFLFDLGVALFIISKGSWRISNRVKFWLGRVPRFCSRRAPNPSELASIFKRVCRLGLKVFRNEVVVTSNFSFPIAFSWGFSSLNSTCFFSRVRRGEVTSARFGMNFPKYVIMPKNCWRSFTEFGNGTCVITSIFAGLTLIYISEKYNGL